MTQLEPTQKQEVKTIVDYIKLDSIQDSAERTLGSRGQQFLTSILSLANNNNAIMECEPRSVYAACLTAATLDLPINPNLGFAYIIPYKARNAKQATAQFQMGYKGFVQLAIRSGEFRHIGANEVRKGQLTGFNDFTGEPSFNFNADETGEVIGYMAYFELLNGFQKAFYMPTEKLEKHAKKYSQSYKKDYGVWVDDFGGMAKKTVLKLLLSKFAPLSTDMQRAIEDDQKVNDEYADNKISFEVQGATVGDKPIDVSPTTEDYIIDEPTEEAEEMITPAQLKKLCASTNELRADLQEIEKEYREREYPGRSRKDFTKLEASTHIKWVEKLKELEKETTKDA